MALKVDVKYNNAVIDTLTSTSTIKYDTAGKYLENILIVDFTGPDDATAASADILTGQTAYIADGTKATGTMPNNGAISSTITTQGGTATIPAGYTSGGTITASITPSVLDNTIISGQAYEEETGDYAWKSTVNLPAGYHNAQTIEKTFSEVFPAPETPGTSADVRLGKQFYDKDGKVITGTMAEKSAATYTASTSDQTISLAQYLAGDQTIKAVSLNATASNMLANTLASIESNGSTVTSVSGNIQTWNGEKKPLPDLCFTANTAGSTIAMSVHGTLTATRDLKYTTDSSTWLTFIPGTTTITLANAGDKVYFRGNNPTGFSEDYNIYYQFDMTGSVAASGNIMSLIDNGACTCTTIPNNYCFENLFYSCNALTSAPELPATTLTESCYEGLFCACSALVIPPVLPATTLALACYNCMFDSCTSLTTPPELPATTLDTWCYQGMFRGCSALTMVPELPATTMKSHCYMAMFQDCIALTEAPALPATTLDGFCYQNMFNGCTALTTIPNLSATDLKGYCYVGMFRDCTSLIISDTSGTGYDKAFVLPTSGTITDDWPQYYMFTNCLGTRATDNFSPAVGKSYTYYTQNTPI